MKNEKKIKEVVKKENVTYYLCPFCSKEYKGKRDAQYCFEDHIYENCKHIEKHLVYNCTFNTIEVSKHCDECGDDIEAYKIKGKQVALKFLFETLKKSKNRKFITKG